jgi:tetratricopeptide (TPR) repeat protein
MAAPAAAPGPCPEHFQLAVCHYRRGAMSECARTARRAIELNPRSAPARYRLAWWRSSTWEAQRRRGAFEETLAGDPESVIACYPRYHPRASGRRGRAIACFERVVRANPHDASAHHLGVNYKRKGLDALAMSALAEALKLDPFDTAAAEELRTSSARKPTEYLSGRGSQCGRPVAACRAAAGEAGAANVSEHALERQDHCPGLGSHRC